jgi:hypothetical protein
MAARERYNQFAQPQAMFREVSLRLLVEVEKAAQTSPILGRNPATQNPARSKNRPNLKRRF